MPSMLWFDVGIKRYTTCSTFLMVRKSLWFDVGIKRYTTKNLLPNFDNGCGLM